MSVTHVITAEEAVAEVRDGDVVMVGGFGLVGAPGDIANWAVPGRDVLGVGGAMDLVVGARRVIVTMTAMTSDGAPKLVPECTYPLTARAAVDVVITEQAVFSIVGGMLTLTELVGGTTLDDVRQSTSAAFATALEAAT